MSDTDELTVIRCNDCGRPKLPKEKFCRTAFDITLGVFYKGLAICHTCVSKRKLEAAIKKKV